MTPKEKAEELLLKYLKMPSHKMFNGWWNKIISKQCALIAVDEMLDFRNKLYINEGSLAHQYLLDIKKEIEKL